MQLAARASLIDCRAFPARHGPAEPFRDLVTTMENALDLRHHQTGTLPRLTPYLHQRTAGTIDSLSRLIRQAAITAISNSTERITKTSLDTIRLDHQAEQHHRPHTQPPHPINQPTPQPHPNVTAHGTTGPGQHQAYTLRRMATTAVALSVIATVLQRAPAGDASTWRLRLTSLLRGRRH
ncbi:hypothetical protein [Streptomyces sp. SID14446]|uniref:hypothetical protein n=1 Tax=Streptomyces sp. SID14446 TaxID=2706072 RepID=UPI0031BB3A15